MIRWKNEELSGKTFHWKKIRNWPLTLALMDGEREEMRLESKALMGMVLKLTYENKEFELRRKQLPPLDIRIKDLTTNQEIGVASYVYAFRKPFIVRFYNKEDLTLSPLSHKDPHAKLLFKDAYWDKGCIFLDGNGRVLAGTLFNRNWINSTKTFHVFEMNRTDPDAFLLAGLAWLAIYATLQETGGY